MALLSCPHANPVDSVIRVAVNKQYFSSRSFKKQFLVPQNAQNLEGSGADYGNDSLKLVIFGYTQ